MLLLITVSKHKPNFIFLKHMAFINCTKFNCKSFKIYKNMPDKNQKSQDGQGQGQDKKKSQGEKRGKSGSHSKSSGSKSDKK